jgi:hypothetical protein
MPINIGVANSLPFSGPFQLTYWAPSPGAGLYAILKYTNGLLLGPTGWTVLYVGETGDFAERGFPSGHHAYQRWVKEAGAVDNLYVATFTMPYSTPEQRRSVEQQLLSEYAPPCNRALPLNIFGTAY